jgi:hypothetical protein
MRKKVQDELGSDAQLFAQQEDLGEFTQRFLVGNDDQFVNAATLQKFASSFCIEDPIELKSPHPVLFYLYAQSPGSLPLPTTATWRTSRRAVFLELIRSSGKRSGRRS